MTHRISVSIYGLLLFALSALPAQVPTPGEEQSQPIYLVGATVHVGNGTVLENAIVGFDKGKLSMVAAAGTAFDRSNADVRDVSGKHIYPGIIAPATTLGLVEIGAVRATRDMNEVGRINPNARAIIAYNTDSRVTPTVRSNGILIAQIVPQGGLITGSSALVQLDAWNWQDAALVADDGIHLNWPRMVLSSGDKKEADKQRKQREKNLAELRSFFQEAAAYRAIDRPEKTNLRFEAMRPVFDGKARLFIRAHDAKSILGAVNFAAEFGITPVIVGAADAWMLTDVLKSRNVPVILSSTHRMPRRAYEDIDMPYKTPSLLKKAGVEYCISGNGSWDQRNLPFLAGTAAAHGLSKEEALEAITLAPARILGLDKTMGSLEVGKDATLIVSGGDVLDMRGNTIEMAFIQGRDIDLDNKQKMLYRKFMRKYDNTGE